MMVGLMTLAATASAQSGKASSDLGGWNSVWVEWNPGTFKVDVKDADNQSFNGFSAGYSHAFRIMSSTPVYAEVGLGVQYSHYEEKYQEEREGYYIGDEWIDNYWVETYESLDMWAVKIPINMLYKYDVPNSPVSLIPFVGVNLRYNVSANIHDNRGDRYGKPGMTEYDPFDEKDMGSSKNTWKHFQLGWNIGVKASFGKHIMAGLSYGNDLSEIAKKTKISTTTVSVGYVF